MSANEMANEMANRGLAWCRALKTKSLYIVGAESEPGAGPVGPVGAVGVQCWCVHTMGTVGPDDGLVTPADCRTGRECFEAR